MAEEKEKPAKETAKTAEKVANKTPAVEDKKVNTKEKPTQEPTKGAISKPKKKPKRRLVTEGKAYIQASFNNTIITIADMSGQTLSQSSAGANGFKGPKKATPYAAQISAEKAAEKAKVYGLETVHAIVKGAGNGREQAIRGLQAGGLKVESIADTTTIAHNGCRPKKTRRT